MASPSTKQFDAASFKDAISQTDKPVLVDFWAPWCAPCLAVGPTIDRLAEQFDGKAIVGKVNVDDVQELAVEYNVQSIPTILIFQGGTPVKRFVGVQAEQPLVDALNDAAPSPA